MGKTDWRAAYDKQMDLWGWWHTPAAARMATGYMRSVSTTGRGFETATTGLIGGQQEVMFRADPIVLDDDMMTLVESAAETFPTEALRKEDLLTPVGFVWLPRPLKVLDFHSKYITIRAFAWGPVQYNVVPGQWGSAPNTDEKKVTVDGLMLTYYSWYGDRDEDDYADHLDLFSAAYGIDMSMVHWEPWLFGSSYKAHPETAGSPNVTLRFIQTMWRLMQQNIVTHERARPDRAARRRAEKRGMADRMVTVIRLRRPKKAPADDHEPAAVNWTHRWITRGHWRNHYFASLGPKEDPTSHRRIWISDFVKGPEDLPLVVKRLRAFEFVQ
jgi:hypothetical protein